MTQTAKKSPFSMNVNLMHGPIFKNLLLFMLPIFISSLFQQLAELLLGFDFLGGDYLQYCALPLFLIHNALLSRK